MVSSHVLYIGVLASEVHYNCRLSEQMDQTFCSIGTGIPGHLTVSIATTVSSKDLVKNNNKIYVSCFIHKKSVKIW